VELDSESPGFSRIRGPRFLARQEPDQTKASKKHNFDNETEGALERGVWKRKLRQMD
jgi:hypothetical protein